MIRRFTENWLDPLDAVLREGELGVDTDTNDIKLGDGATEFSALPVYGSTVGVGKHSLWFPVANMVAVPPATASRVVVDAGTNDQSFEVLDLNATTDVFFHFQVAFPKSWNKGAITYQVVWTCDGTDTDAVVWGLQGVAVSDGDVLDASWGTAVLVTDNLQSAAGKLYVAAESAAVTIGGTPANADLVFLRIYRDADHASDTASENARLIGVRVFYTTDAATDD